MHAHTTHTISDTHNDTYAYNLLPRVHTHTHTHTHTQREMDLDP